MNKIQYHDTILDLVGNTPLVSLQKIASPMLGQFFAKLEAFNPGHSAKDRTALYIINDGLECRRRKYFMDILDMGLA